MFLCRLIGGVGELVKERKVVEFIEVLKFYIFQATFNMSRAVS